MELRSKPSRRGRAWRGLAAAVALVMLAPPSSLSAQPMEREVNALLTSSRLGTSQVGVSVTDAGTGEVLASINERQAFAPASNLKLLTSGTALMVLGKDFEFKTKFVRDGDRLIIIGAGDPALGDPKLLSKMGLSLEQFIDRLVGSMREAQVAGIREVVVDDRVFDRDTIHPGWPKNQLNKWYCAPVAGLSFYTNVLEIYPGAGERVGAAPGVRTAPSARWIEIINHARTVKDGATTLWAAQEATGDFRFSLYGEFRAAPDEPIEVTVREPGLLFARLVADRIGKAAMGVSGGTPAVRPVELSEGPFNGPIVAMVKTPLSEVLERCNTDSQNLYAECLMKRLGHAVTGQSGSWTAGSTVVRMQLNEKLGPEAGELVMVDGSGLAKENRVTPSMITAWLGVIFRDPANGPVFLRSMATSNEGRLKDRFKGRKLANEVFGKTGYIQGVLCLSGYVVNSTTGRAVAYSVLINNYPSSVPPARLKEFQDEVVVAVDRWLSKQPSRQAGVPGGG